MYYVLFELTYDFFALTATFIIMPLLTRATFPTVKLHLHSHDICFTNTL